MKICICVNSFYPFVGGAEKVCEKVADFLATDNDVFIFTRYTKHRSKENLNSYNNYVIIEYTPGDWNKFHQKLNSINPDVVLIYSDVFDYFSHIVSTSHHFKTILSFCGANYIHRHKAFYNTFKRNLNHIHKIILHSTRERDYTVCKNLQCIDKTTIIPNGVDLQEFDNNYISREDLLPGYSDKFWILNISNFFPNKGQEHLIDIISQIPPKKDIVYIQVCNDIQFSIGQTLENKWWKKSRCLIKVGTTVKLMKNLSRNKVIGFLKQSNVFAFTSEKEIFPLVMLEAMGSRLPWVAADVGNILDLKGGTCITARKNYLYNSIFDPAVKKLFAQAIQNTKKTCLGRKQVEENFTWDKILPEYSKLIEKICR